MTQIGRTAVLSAINYSFSCFALPPVLQRQVVTEELLVLIK